MNKTEFNVYFFVGVRCAFRIQRKGYSKGLEIECERDEFVRKLRTDVKDYIQSDYNFDANPVIFNLFIIRDTNPEFHTYVSGILQGMFDCSVRFWEFNEITMFNRIFSKEDVFQRLKELGNTYRTDKLGRHHIFESHRYEIIRDRMKSEKQVLISPELSKVILLSVYYNKYVNKNSNAYGRIVKWWKKNKK